MSTRSNHSGPPPSHGERALPSRPLGAPNNARPEAKDKDSCKDSLLNPPTTDSTDQNASDANLSKHIILVKLERAVREVGDEMKKAEKLRKRIEEFTNLEEYAWFDRVENLLSSQDRFLRVQAAENKMITHDGEKKAAKQQTEQTERFKHVENMIVAHRVAYFYGAIWSYVSEAMFKQCKCSILALCAKDDVLFDHLENVKRVRRGTIA
jgi:hypothetical protein